MVPIKLKTQVFAHIQPYSYKTRIDLLILLLNIGQNK